MTTRVRASQIAIPEEEEEDEEPRVSRRKSKLEEEEEEEEEEEDDDDENDTAPNEPESEEEDESSYVQPRLKIRLKMPQLPDSATATPTPDDIQGTPRRPRAANSKRKPAIESESEEEEEDEFEDEEPASESTPSSSVPPGSKRLTTRQAVLASVVDPSHVALDDESTSQTPTGKGKKKQLNESELALRREETARKRRNLTEKKLEDEKAETINRLLKKQSKPRGKKAALAATTAAPSPLSGVPSKAEDIPGSVAGDEDDAMDVDEEDPAVRSTPPAPPESMMYRWISTSQSSDSADGPSRTLSLTFSVPTSLTEALVIDTQKPRVPPSSAPCCDVAGCSALRKYRLVKDWTRGACGMSHLKILEGQLMDTST